MSKLFRNRPDVFVKHDHVSLFGTDAISVDRAAPKRNSNEVASDRSPAPLRDGHIVLLALDVLLALHASFDKWRSYRRTLRALADLNEDQLRDIGLTPEDTLPGQHSRRVLAEFNKVRRQSA